MHGNMNIKKTTVNSLVDSNKEMAVILTCLYIPETQIKHNIIYPSVFQTVVNRQLLVHPQSAKSRLSSSCVSYWKKTLQFEHVS